MGNSAFKILSIDDNSDYQAVTARFFALNGPHMVFVAENGTDGLKKAADVRPDIILVDMNLPDMTGLEVINNLYQDPLTREIPAIMITGSRLSQLEHTDLKASKNAVWFEEKPVDMKALLHKIEALLLGHEDKG